MQWAEFTRWIAINAKFDDKGDSAMFHIILVKKGGLSKHPSGMFQQILRGMFCYYSLVTIYIRCQCLHVNEPYYVLFG